MPSTIKAAFFDVFGTLADWHGGIAREAERILRPRGLALDWHAFARAWRAQYQPSLEEVRSGRMRYEKLDALHRRNLANVLAKFQLTGIDDNMRDDLVLAWHKLDAWPDVTPGLRRLKRRLLIAPVSNGNIALMADLARHNDFVWDAILGADLARDYKPKREVYRSACDAFNLRPDQCLMVAAHSSDLAAAAECGLRTAHVARPNEAGTGKGESGPSVPVDFTASSVEELAAKLGA